MAEDYIQRIILLIPPMLIALTAHECAHAWVADKLGDRTARMLGRITLNPIKHLDPIGTLALFLTGMFGWAKPVPINPRNLKNPARDMMWISLAGPVTNLSLAAVFAVLHKVLLVMGENPSVISSGLFRPFFIMVNIGVVLNVALGVFNMIPVPPLDGSKVLTSLLPPDKAYSFSRIEPYGFIILMLLIFTGLLHKFMSPLIMVTVGLLTGGI